MDPTRPVSRSLNQLSCFAVASGTSLAPRWRPSFNHGALSILVVGEKLDGEGGYTVYGKLVPAARSLASKALPIGLAHHIVVKRPIKAGSIVMWHDVVADEGAQAVRVRREMEALFREPTQGAGHDD